MLDRHRIQVLGAVGVLFILSLAVAADGPVLSVELSLEPGVQAGTYLATILVSDAASGALLSAPRLTFRAGEPAKTSSQTASGELVQLEVAVSSDGSEASFLVQLVRDGEPLMLQKGKVRLGGRQADSDDVGQGAD